MDRKHILLHGAIQIAVGVIIAFAVAKIWAALA